MWPRRSVAIAGNGLKGLSSDIDSFACAGLDEDVVPPLINEATFSNQLCVSDRVANDVEAKIIAAIAVRLVIAISRVRDFLKSDRLELEDVAVGRVEENILIEAPNKLVKDVRGF